MLQLGTGHFQLNPDADDLAVDAEAMSDKDVGFLFEPILKEVDRLMDELFVKRLVNSDASLAKFKEYMK